MNKRLLLVLFTIGIIISCDSAKADVKSNPNLSGLWHSTKYLRTFIEIEGSDYREILGEINSEMKGKIHWKDSLNIELEVTEVKGDALKGTSMKPGKIFQIEILEVSPTQLRLHTNNTTSTWTKAN